MIIRAIKLRAITEKGDFGFSFSFARNLTIIRGSNSSGKSTLVNSMLYAIGMEEIIGGKGERVLPYSVKDYFEYNDVRVNIAASKVLIEIENSSGQIITLRRAIRDEVRDSKLVEVFNGAHLTSGEELGVAIPTYLHDPGSARKQEGFHRYLETFLGIELPQVATTNGGETKLYLQAVFAALAVEQKRGWTDYIANIPFYSIRDARTRVVEYLLGLSVFETSAQRNRLDTEAVAINSDWRRIADELRRDSASKGVVVEGLPYQPVSLFEVASVQLQKQTGSSKTPLHDYISHLVSEYALLKERAEKYNQSTGAEMLKEIDAVTEELQRLSVLHERATVALGLQRSSLREYEDLLKGVKEDLDRNKTAEKLRELGARHAVELATGHCPTCHQPVEDTLLSETVTGPQMDLETNIGYLNSQCRMLQRQIAGLREDNRQSEATVAELAAQLAVKRDYLNALRGDLSSGATESRAIVRRQVQIEVEVEELERLEDHTLKQLDQLKEITKRLAENQLARKKLPRDYYTADDEARISLFQKQFRANAGSFGYESAPIDEIEISRDKLVPCLSQLELREIRTDIKSDSSASDFVRLIWSYLLALHQTSVHPTSPGNHLGILLLDEPGQHSMAVDSQHALLQHLAAESRLQSIVAASFDEAEFVFKEATDGVTYKLIEWDGKLLRPL
jgi:hypothetical protein